MSKLRDWFFEKTTSKDRLVKGDKPTESNFKELLSSILFFNEKGDRAKVSSTSYRDNEAGHVTLANNTQVANRELQTTDRSLVVQPHQLETLVQGDGITLTKVVDVDGRTSITIDAEGTDPVEAALVYYVNASNPNDGNGSFLNPFKNLALALSRIDGTGTGGASGDKVITRVTIKVAAGFYQVSYSLWRGINYDFDPGVIIESSFNLFDFSNFTSAQGGEIYNAIGTVYTEGQTITDAFSHPNVYGESEFQMTSTLLNIPETTSWGGRKEMNFSFAKIERSDTNRDQESIIVNPTGYTGTGGNRLTLNIIGNNSGRKGVIGCDTTNSNTRGSAIKSNQTGTGVSGRFPTYEVDNIAFEDRSSNATVPYIDVNGAEGVRFTDCEYNASQTAYNNDFVKVTGEIGGLFFTNIKSFHGSASAFRLFNVDGITPRGQEVFQMDNITYTHSVSVSDSFKFIDFKATPTFKIKITNVFSFGGAFLNGAAIPNLLGAGSISTYFDFESGGAMTLEGVRLGKTEFDPLI